jgi:putative transposase
MSDRGGRQMPRPRAHDRRYFHAMHRRTDRRPLFTRPREYRAFLAILRDGLTRHPMRLISYCLLCDHWHLVLGPIEAATLTRLLHWVAATHASRLRGPDASGVYTSGVDIAALATSADLMRVCRHVERTAVRASLVQRAQDWPWSSLAERLHDRPRLPLVSTRFLESAAWLDFVNTPLAPDRSDDRAEPPGRLAGLLERRERGLGVARRAHEDQPHAHVERAEHLDVRNPAGLLQPAENRRHGPTVAIE